MTSRELIFRLAYFWKINPFDLYDRTLEDIDDLVFYAEAFVKEENEQWEKAKQQRR